MSVRVFLTIFLSAGVAVFVGCGVPKSSGDIMVRDVEIVRDVKLLLDTNGFPEVWVECRSGVVTLRGRVHSQESARRASRLAADGAGVEKVISLMEVREK